MNENVTWRLFSGSSEKLQQWRGGRHRPAFTATEQTRNSARTEEEAARAKPCRCFQYTSFMIFFCLPPFACTYIHKYKPNLLLNLFVSPSKHQRLLLEFLSSRLNTKSQPRAQTQDRITTIYNQISDRSPRRARDIYIHTRLLMISANQTSKPGCTLPSLCFTANYYVIIKKSTIKNQQTIVFCFVFLNARNKTDRLSHFNHLWTVHAGSCTHFLPPASR